MKHTHKVIILINDTRDSVVPLIIDGVKRYCAWVSRVTNKEFVIQPTFQTVDEYLTTYPVDIAVTMFNTKAKGYLVNPYAIADIGTRYEKILKKQFDTVCIFNNPNNIVGEAPTHPAHHPIYIDGFTVIQLLSHAGWGTDEKKYPSDATKTMIAQTFAHEMLHAMTFIINYESGFPVIPDVTHSKVVYDSDNGQGYGETITVLMKPYWHLLCGQQIMPDAITENLKYGDTGAQVHILQSRLQDLGYMDYGTYGPYGPKTARAVLAWQIDHKVDSLLTLIALKGRYFGPKSRIIMNDICL